MDTLSFSYDETANFSNKNIRLLKDIPVDDFSSLLSIYKYLNLSNNNLTVIDSDFINKFVNICYLNVSSNKITKIQGIELLRNLQFLDVSNNEITVIESMGNCNETLEKLMASHNNINSIFFNTNMSKLEYIDIRENRINKLSFGKFVPHLHTLKVDNNFLNDISGLSDFNELEVFSASSNQITEIPKLSKFALRTINLSNNKISSLLFLNQPKLVTLDISGNPIADDGISDRITVNKNLLNLFISSAQITRCHCLAKIFPYLSTVDLSKTKLDNLNDLLSFVHEMKNIKVLDVRFTPLTRDIYPGLDPLVSGNSLFNQSSSFQSQQRSSFYSDPEQEKHYDSIIIYNQIFPENSEERIRFRSEIIKSSISQLQILDHIKVSQSEYSAIDSQPIKLSVNNIIEEEEDIDNEYNLEYTTGIEEEEEEFSIENFSENKNEIQYKIEMKPPNSSENFNFSTGDVSGKITASQIDIESEKSSTTDQFDVSNEKEIENDIQKVIYLQNANSSISNYSDNQIDDYSPSENLSSSSSSQNHHSFEFDLDGENYNPSKYSHHSSRHSHQSSKKSHHSFKFDLDSENCNPSKQSHHSSMQSQHSSKHSHQSSKKSHHSSQQICNSSKKGQNSSFKGQNLSFQSQNLYFKGQNLSFQDQNSFKGKNSSFQGQSSLHLSSSGDLNSFKSFNSNSKQHQQRTQPFFDNPNLYKFLTHVSEDEDDDLLDVTESESEEAKNLNQNQNQNENYDDDDEKEEEEDDVMITTQIIAQTLSGNRQKDDIDKSIEYINRSVQAEIDSIFTEQKKREHDEKMKKIKKLRKENKILEKEIKKYKMKKKTKLGIEEETSNKNEAKSKQPNPSINKKESKHHHSHKVEQTNSKSKSKSFSKTQIQNSSKSSHHHHVHSNSTMTIKNSSKSHHHHHHNKDNRDSHSKIKMPNENLPVSDHFLNSKLKKSSDSSNFSDSNSTSNTISTSNSYIVKTKKKSISIEESEVTPEISKNSYDFNNSNENKHNILKAQKKSQKSSKDASFKFPQIIELLDGLLAENEKLGGKIAVSIKKPSNSTPISPNQESPTQNSMSSSFSSQKVASKSKNSKNQDFSSQINRTKSNSIIVLSNEINNVNLPQITRDYAEQKIIQSLKKIDHYSPLTENSKELKYLFLWLIEGLPYSANNIKHDIKDISMVRKLNLGNYNCNLAIKAADKNRNYQKFFESQKQLKNLQLLMLFNFNNSKSNDDCSKSYSESGLDLDLIFNFDVDQIPQDAEFFKNINYLFKGMPPFLCITVCVVDLGRTKTLSNVKVSPTESQQDKIASKGFNSICYEKNGLKHYILFDKAHAVPVYTLLFSTV